MKPIKDMNLSECINRLRELPDGTIEDQFDMRDLPWIFDVAEELADRIHDLTRWIPVSEQMPTEEDVDENGEVLGWSPEPHVTYTASCIPLSYHFTHWQRITPTEGV